MYILNLSTPYYKDAACRLDMQCRVNFVTRDDVRNDERIKQEADLHGIDDPW